MKYILSISILVVFVALTSSLFAQTNWTKYEGNPVLENGLPGSDDASFVSMPSVLFDGSVYHMWYCYGNTEKLERFGHAISEDGISWTKDALNNPVLEHGPTGSWDAYGISVPFVLHLDTLYHMWYKGYSTSNLNGPGALGHATSPDGTNWNKDGQNPVLEPGANGEWDDVWLGCPSIIFDGNIYHMWYNAWNGNLPDVVRIGHATSYDGTTWTKDPNNPVLDRGSSNSWEYPRADEPNVTFDGTIFHMWYLGGKLFPSRVGYAWSRDGSNWTKYKNNPVLDVGAAGTFDDYGIGFFSIMLDTVGYEMKMWYTGFSAYWNLFNSLIGYATAPAIINVPNDYETIQEAIDTAHDGNVILVEEGTYYENINFRGKAITVASQFIMDGDTSHISKTIIDGSQNTNPDSGSVVYFIAEEDTTSILCGFTITGGSGTYYDRLDLYLGGGIWMEAGGKILHNKIMGNNLVSEKGIYGAGLSIGPFNDSANLVMEHNEIKYNSIVSPKQSGGGGLQIMFRWWTGGYCRLKNNVISNNSVTCTGTYKTIAGGIILSLPLPTVGTVIIESNIFSHNELHCVASVGAGVYVVYFEPGGTVIDNNPSPLISNNIISNNYSEDKGGGLGVWTVENNHQSNSIISPQPAFINNTIVNNKANDGSGIFNFDSYPLLLNNILWDDTTSGSREIFNDDIDYPEYWDKINGGELFVYYSDVQGGWEGEGNMDAYPSFVDTSSNNFALLESSRCIGNGIDSLNLQEYWYTCPNKDYYGNKRPNIIDEFIDMGAIESEYIVNDIFREHKVVIDKYSLSQNYPNPFNPSTTIEFSLPKSELVELKVYNILGKEVTTLVSNKLNSGNHTYTFDGKNLASGVYYYQLVAGDYREVKKMILLR